uniref:Uncharacterized protein n=1 Tax=viral metagenome TaxID=1070528 RepID=A0A6M3KA76_9ZZZZ
MNCVILHYQGGEVLLEAEEAVRLAEILLVVTLGSETWDSIPGKALAVSRNSLDYCTRAREAMNP